MNKITNPLTGYKIQVGGATYRNLLNQGILPAYQRGGKAVRELEMRYNDIKGYVEVLDWKKATKVEEDKYFKAFAEGRPIKNIRYNDIKGYVEVEAWKKATQAQEKKYYADIFGKAF